MKPDPVVFFRAPQDGECMLELRDVIYRGRGDFIYRLTVGAAPYVTDIFPLGGQRGSEAAVELHGVNLPANSMWLAIPPEGPRILRAHSLPFAASDLPSAREAEPNDSPAQAQRLDSPLDSILTLYNAKNQPLGENDDWNNPLRLLRRRIRRWASCRPP